MLPWSVYTFIGLVTIQGSSFLQGTVLYPSWTSSSNYVYIPDDCTDGFDCDASRLPCISGTCGCDIGYTSEYSYASISPYDELTVCVIDPSYSGAYPTYTTPSSYSDYCLSDYDCGTAGTPCVSGTCGCEIGYTPTSTYLAAINYTTCAPDPSYGGPYSLYTTPSYSCFSNYECASYGVPCIDGTCGCEIGYTQTSTLYPAIADYTICAPDQYSTSDCMYDIDCGYSGYACYNGTCDCQSGYTMTFDYDSSSPYTFDSTCVPDQYWTPDCTLDSDCGYSGYACYSGTCDCQSGYTMTSDYDSYSPYTYDSSCVPDLYSTSDCMYDSDCGYSGYACYSGTCDCQSGYTMTFDYDSSSPYTFDSTCVPDLHSTSDCMHDGDCGYSGYACYSGTCDCQSGYTMTFDYDSYSPYTYDSSCVPDLHSTSDCMYDSDCGYSGYACYSGTCDCQSGYTMTFDYDSYSPYTFDSTCVPDQYWTPDCTLDSDCGYSGYACYSGTCDCQSGYTMTSDYDSYSPYTYDSSCVPDLYSTSDCMYDSDCGYSGYACYSGTCDCQSGYTMTFDYDSSSPYTFDSTCVPDLHSTSDCMHDGDCGYSGYACYSGTCDCQSGYTMTFDYDSYSPYTYDSSCVPDLHSTSDCMYDSDCGYSGYACYSGTCDCQSGYTMTFDYDSYSPYTYDSSCVPDLYSTSDCMYNSDCGYSGYTCYSGTCDCQSGYTMTFDYDSYSPYTYDSSCVPDQYWTPDCTLDIDCGPTNYECYSGTCDCQSGYTMAYVYVSSSSDPYDSTCVQDSGITTSSPYYGDIPNLGEISIHTIVEVDVSDGNPKAAVQCHFTTESAFRYKIAMGSDGVDGSVSEILQSDAVADYYVWMKDVLVSPNALDRTYYCKVTAYNSLDEEFGPIIADVGSPVNYNYSLVIDRNGFISFWVSLEIPFTCPNNGACALNIKFYDIDNEDLASDCSYQRIAFADDTCGAQVTSTAVVSSDPDQQNVGTVSVNMTIKNNLYYASNDKNLGMAFEIEGDAESWWNTQFSTPIQVHVSQNPYYNHYSYCSIENDPWVWTFDGLFYYLDCDYSVFSPCEHIATISMDLPVQVNVLTEECVTGGSCACGLIIRAGGDVLSVNYCKHVLNGNGTKFLSYTDKVMELWKIWDNLYEVILPHGMVVVYSISKPAWFTSNWMNSTLVNIFIYPAATDFQRLHGLCGDFNGIWTDDLIHSDGLSTSVVPFSYWNPFDDFLQSWEVSGIDWSNMPQYQPDHKLCVCTGTYGNDQLTCSVKETDWCDLDMFGATEMDPEKMQRKRRSAERRSRKVHLTENPELIEAMNAKSVFSSKNQRKRRSNKNTKRVKRQNTMSYEDALILAELQMNNGCPGIYNSPEAQSIKDPGNQTITCALNIMLNSDVDWCVVSCENFKTVIDVTIDKFSEELNVSVSSVINDLCPLNCGGHGTCSAGVCSCDNGFSGSDCTLDLSEKPTVTVEDDVCDLTAQTCSYILIRLDAVVQGALCKVEVYVVNIDGSLESQGTFTSTLIVVTYMEAYCEIPDSKKRRRRSIAGSSSSTGIAYSYSITASNDGTTYSVPVSVVSLDTTCLTYNSTSGSVTLAPGYCVIDGTCYTNSTIQSGLSCSSCDMDENLFGWTVASGQCLIDGICYADDDILTGNACYFCNSSLENTQWTKDTSTASCSSTNDDDEEEGLETYIIVVIVLCVLLGIAALAVGGIFLVKKFVLKKKVSFARSNGLFDNQMNKRFKLRPDTANGTSGLSTVDNPRLYAWQNELNPEKAGIPDDLYTDSNCDHPAPVPVLSVRPFPTPSTSSSMPDGATS